MDLFHRSNPVRNPRNNSDVYFQNRRWHLVSLLEKLSGTWPYQNKQTQLFLQTFYLLTYAGALFVLGNKARVFVGVDMDNLVNSYCIITLTVIVMVKLMFASIFQGERKEIYERVVKHFNTITDVEEAMVLKQCADRSFKYTVVYLCLISVGIGIFDCVPILEAFFNHLVFHDELKMELPLPNDYGFDHKKYWYVILIHYTVLLDVGLIIQWAYDLSFLLQIRHVQGLFKIVRMRLDRASQLTDEFEDDTISEEAIEEANSIILSAIDLHSECLEIVGIIENVYSTNWLVVLFMSASVFGAGLHLVATKLHDPFELFRYFSLFAMDIIHFQVIFSQGQRIIDSNSAISDACYECKWYGLPQKSRQLLLMMMIRTSKPCQLTGGKLFSLNTETFGKMLKAGLSYYSVFEA